MSDKRTNCTTVSGQGLRSRRRYLSVLAALGAGAFAGCSGGGDGSSDPESSSGDGNESATPPGIDCPSLPLSYTEERVNEPQPLRFEVPSEANFNVATPSENFSNIGVTFGRLRADGNWNLRVEAGTEDDSEIDSIRYAEERYGEEVTTDYDLAVDNARAFANPPIWYVFLPATPDPIRLIITAYVDQEDVCSDAAIELRDRFMESVQLVQ